MEFAFRENSHVTKNWKKKKKKKKKKTFPKEFFNNIGLKVGEYKYIYIF